MKEGRPSRTAHQNALFRALEARRAPTARVADDPLAVRFLPPDYRLLAELARIGPARRLTEAIIDRRWPGPRAGVVARTRLIDETIAGHLPAVGQVLILGAGFDTRPYRMAAMATQRVFEVDHPLTQQDKKKTLARMPGGLPAHVYYVPVVFGRDDPGDALVGAGFVTGQATLALWEGVTNYLDDASVGAAFSFLTAALGPGSPLLFTYVHRGIIDGSAHFRGAREAMEHVERLGEPFTFGFDPAELPTYLRDRGFELAWDVAVSDAARCYYPNGNLPPVPAYYHVVESRRT